MTWLIALFFLLPTVFADSVDSAFTTSSVTANNVALVSAVIATANYKRRGIIMYNNSANSVYVSWAATSTSTGCALIIPSFQSWFWLTPPVYIGVISAIRNAGTGAVNVYEFW